MIKAKNKKVNTTPTEAWEQETFIEFLELYKKTINKNLIYSATAQSTYTTSWSQKIKNKKMGVRPGVPDLIVIIDTKLIFIEMKRVKGGVLSPAQKEWIDRIDKTGNYVIVARGCQEAITFFTKIVEKNKPLL
jgi:hypothetical protein